MIETNCAMCNEPVLVYESVYNSSKYRHSFCCKEHYREYKKTLTGEKASNFKTGHINEDVLRNLYEVEFKTKKECANELKVSTSTIDKYFRKYGIKGRSTSFHVKKMWEDDIKRQEILDNRSKNKKETKIEVECAYCGKKKKIKKSQYERSKTKRFFCPPDKSRGEKSNSECRRKWESENRIGINNPTYSKVIIQCANCGNDKEIKYSQSIKRENHFCNPQCMGEWFTKNGTNKGENSSLWKGGVKELNIPLFDTYAHQIDFAIECRRSLENSEILEIRCSYCNKWHVPSLSNLKNKCRDDLNDIKLYCNYSCAEQCPVYKQRKFPKGYKQATSREVNPWTRKAVFERDDWTCQRCGSIKSLQCHHILGKALYPMLIDDIDNCITFCKSCHKWIHSLEGCSYFDLRCDKTDSLHIA